MVTLKSMAVVLFFSRHTITSPTPSLTSIVRLANSTLTTAKVKETTMLDLEAEHAAANHTILPSLSVMETVVCLSVPSWGPGCPGGRVSSTVNTSAPSRATRSSITAMFVQAVSFPFGKLNVLEICSKSAPPGERKYRERQKL